MADSNPLQPDNQMPTLKKPIKPFFNPSAPVEEEHSNDALLILAAFSFIMFTLPIAVFFFVRDFLKTNDYDEIYILWGPVLAAIITVNIIICVYVYRAYQIEKKASRSQEKEKSQ